MSEQIRTALPVLLPVIGAVTALLMLAWQPWRKTTDVEHRRGCWAAPVAFALAFVIAFAVIEGTRGFQLKDRWHWMLRIAGTGSALGVIAAIWRPAFATRLIFALLLALSAGALLRLPADFSSPVLWKAAFGGVVLIAWLNLDGLAKRSPGARLPLALAIVFTALSMILLQSYQAKFSLLAAAMAACCGIIVVFALLDRRINLGSGGALASTAILASMVFIWWLYCRDTVGTWPFALILLSPAGLWPCEWLAASRSKPWRAAVLGVVGVALLAGLAVFLSVAAKEG